MRIWSLCGAFLLWTVLYTDFLSGACSSKQEDRSLVTIQILSEKILIEREPISDKKDSPRKKMLAAFGRKISERLNSPRKGMMLQASTSRDISEERCKKDKKDMLISKISVTRDVVAEFSTLDQWLGQSQFIDLCPLYDLFDYILGEHLQQLIFWVQDHKKEKRCYDAQVSHIKEKNIAIALWMTLQALNGPQPLKQALAGYILTNKWQEEVPEAIQINIQSTTNPQFFEQLTSKNKKLREQAFTKIHITQMTQKEMREIYERESKELSAETLRLDDSP